MLKSLQDSVRRIFFTHHQPLPAGIYQYQAPPDAPQPYRLHLRIEPGGEGLLIVNAKTVLHLNQTAAEYAYYLVQSLNQVQGLNQDEIADKIALRYQVNRGQALDDFLKFRERIDTLIHSPDLDPVTYLDIDRHEPYSHAVTAPYRLDCALTYRLAGHLPPGIAPIERVKRELTLAEWQIVLDKAWAAGIPQVIFTGGEPTLRPDLIELIVYTQKLGMVSGLLTDGLRLAETEFLHDLLQSGLDHVIILLDPAEDQSWEALRDCLAEDLFVTVHLTLTPASTDGLAALFDRLAQMGVKSLSLSANNPSLSALLKEAQQAAADRQLSLVWDLPVPYSAMHPVALDLAEESHVQGAGSAWLYVEPDGDVTPTQGITTVLGNLLTDPWEAIWKNRPQA